MLSSSTAPDYLPESGSLRLVITIIPKRTLGCHSDKTNELGQTEVIENRAAAEKRYAHPNPKRLATNVGRGSQAIDYWMV
jgi:hypothetical protein